MHFAFSEDQLLFQQAVGELLAKECPHEAVAEAWASETGRIPGLWAKLAEMGVVGLMVPEAHGGLGMRDLDMILLLQEAGRAAAPEPLLETAGVAVPMLRDAGGELAAAWLPKIAEGGAVVALGLEGTDLVADAHVADLLVLERAGTLYALPPDGVQRTARASVDSARRLFEVEWEPASGRVLAEGEAAARLIAEARERGALGSAAQLVGLGRYMIDLTVEYAKGREQFGQAIGAFQAVKHHLSNALVKLEFARPLVYHATYTCVNDWESRGRDVSNAKAYAAAAAQLCGRVALQCHGAIGYTHEYHLHMWMKRAWSLTHAWGDAAWHRKRLARLLLDSA